MVYEFPELQGTMGREYALIQGENPVVAKAVYEHYLPTSGGGDLPQTEEGSIVSIADKTDTIVGFFGINVIPTGTADPYALRRQALGIINIILNKGYPIELPELVDRSIAILSKKFKRTPEETKKDVLEFFRSRFSNQLVSQGRPYDVVESVLATGITDLVQAIKKIEAVEATKGDPDFEPLAVAFKRVSNILKDFKDGCVDPVLFENEAEPALYNAYIEIRKKAEALIEMGNYTEALLEMVRLRKPVDSFFEAVMVMAKDEKVKFNRLSLLEAVAKLFHKVADFSKIVTEK
jgi:glycyl-tRNA synthetase beta chain